MLLLSAPLTVRESAASLIDREHHAKREVIVYDYVDSGVTMLACMALKRQAGYRSLGYMIAAG